MTRAEQLWMTYQHNIENYNGQELESGMIIKTTDGDYFIIGDLVVNGRLRDGGCGCCADYYSEDQIEYFIRL